MSAHTEDDEKPVLRDAKGRLLPGSRGLRRAGRPTKDESDSRQEMAKGLFRSLRDDFDLFGDEVITRVREERPVEYLRIVASLVPKELKLTGQVEVTYLDLLEDVQRRIIDSTAEVLDEDAPESDSPGSHGTFALPPLPDDPDPLS